MIRNVFLVALTYQLMVNSTRPLVSLYASELGASTATVGLLISANAFFPLLLAISIGKMIDRFGIRLPVMVGLVELVVAFALPFLFPSLWALFVSQALVGISQIFINVALQNAMGQAADKEQRDRNFSILSLGMSVGSMMGPVVGGVVGDHFGFAFAFLMATIFGLIPVMTALLLPRFVQKAAQSKGRTEKQEKFSSFALLKSSALRKALTASMLVLYSRDIYMAYFPLYASSIGISASAIGLILTIQGGASVFIRIILIRLTQWWGRNGVLFVSLLTAGIAFSVIPLFHQIYWFWGLAILLGAGLGCGQPLSMSITYSSSVEGKTGETLGLRMAFNRLSQVIAPFIFGLVGSFGGLAAVFYVSGSFLMGGSLLTMDKRNKGRKNEATSD